MQSCSGSIEHVNLNDFTFVHFSKMIVYQILYSLFIHLYRTAIQLAASWNPKARKWVDGRRNLLNRVKADNPGSGSKVVWMHCSSLGEYEQGRPLIQKMKANSGNTTVVVTFFSPSGYEIVKKNPDADFTYYLPFGDREMCRRFIEMVNPSVVLWVKYDYWYYYLDELQKRGAVVLLIAANFRESQPFFKWYGRLHRKMLTCFTHFFVQSPDSKVLLEKVGFHNVTIAGDTRFDRVIEIASSARPIDVVTHFCGTRRVIVAGSTWGEDEEELDHYANTHPEIAFIIAPHEIDELHLTGIEKLFRRTIRYSLLERYDAAEHHMVEKETNVLIIDNIGMLSKLYQYATITYVGGGFGDDGVHNVLEAAVYGKPVIFGPVYDKFLEAKELLETGGGISIETGLELEKTFNDLLTDKEYYDQACDASRKYVYGKKGATENILSFIQENRLLTS